MIHFIPLQDIGGVVTPKRGRTMTSDICRPVDNRWGSGMLPVREGVFEAHQWKEDRLVKTTDNMGEALELREEGVLFGAYACCAG